LKAVATLFGTIALELLVLLAILLTSVKWLALVLAILFIVIVIVLALRSQ
jgi:hypothetical protein